MYRVERMDVMDGLATLADSSVDLIVCDAPYNSMNKHLQLGKGRIVGDYSGKADWFEEFDDTPENYQAFLSECRRVMKDDRHIFLMFDPYSLLTLAPTVREHFDVKNVITWDKVNIGMGHYFRRRSEFVIFASKGKRPLMSRSIPDVWGIKRIHRAAYPTEKPVALFRQMIDASLPEGAGMTVLDPFMGSGASGVAALQAGHRYVGFDIAEKSIAMASERLAETTKENT